MLKEALIELFERDLNRLKKEISLYDNETKLWLVRDEISNSAGNLCLHLLGNLNHFIGALLGNSDFVRDRDSEFASKYVTRQELITSIEQTIETVKNVLNDLPDEILEKDFSVEINDKISKTDYVLIHLFGHFSYHLGQINYHRRLIS